MTAQKLIVAASDLSLPASMLLGADKRVDILPQDALGNMVALYSKLTDAVAGGPTYAFDCQKDYIGGQYLCSGNYTKLGAAIKFGPTYCLYALSANTVYRIPLSSPLQNASGFVIEFTIKFANSTGEACIINEGYYTVAGLLRWKLTRNGTTGLNLYIYDSALSPTMLANNSFTLNTTTVWRVRLGYDSSGTNGHCNAFLSIAPDGSAFSATTSAVMRKAAPVSPLYGKSCGICIGSTITDHTTNGFIRTADGGLFYMEELIGYASYISGLSTGTPATTVLQPYRTTDPVELIFANGCPTEFDLSTFATSDDSMCASSNGGPGWNFCLTQGGTYLSLANLKVLGKITNRTKSIWAKIVQAADGCSNYPLAWFGMNAIPQGGFPR